MHHINRINGIMRKIIVIVMTIVICGSFCFSCYSWAESSKTKTVKIGWYGISGLQDLSNEGKPRGYNYEYLRAINQYTDWNYEFVNGTFDECVKWLAEGKIDMVGGIFYDEERAGTMSFSDISSGTSGIRLMTSETDKEINYADYKAMDGKTVGLIKSGILEEELKKYCTAEGFSVKFATANTEAQLKRMLSNGTVDLIAMPQTWKSQGYRTVLDFSSKPFYFTVNKNKTELLNQLNYAMSQIKAKNPYFDANLFEKYFNASSSTEPAFTSDELEYIKENPEILVAYDPSWRPIEYYNMSTGEMDGMMKDIFAKISEQTGMNFRFVTADSFVAAQEKFNEKAQMFSALSYDYDWGDELNYKLTKPIYTMQISQVYKKNKDGKTIAMPEGYYITEKIQEHYRAEGYEYILYPTTEECLNAVNNGRADATFVNGYELNYYMSNPKYSKLGFQSILGLNIKLSVAVSDDEDPRLFSIIDRAVSNISESELEQIYSKNMLFDRDLSIKDAIYTYPVQALMVLIIFTLLVLLITYFVHINKITKEQAAELSALNKQLIQANKAKSDFVSRVSHDIRTPISAILSMTAFAKEDIDNKEKLVDELNKIESANTLLLSLINDVLDISKMDSGGIELHPEVCFVEEKLLNILSIFETLCAEKQIEFVVKTDNLKSKWARVDCVRVSQVVLNLLSNAVKYTPKGGRILFEVSSRDIDDAMMVMSFRFQDNGIGMSESFQKKMFDPFTQDYDNPERTKLTGGTGLGLAIIKRLIDIMGGRIIVESKIDEGTDIQVIIPMGKAEPSQEEIDAGNNGNSEVKNLGIKVLLVEDNNINAEIAKRILGSIGVESDWAQNGKEALVLFEAAPEIYTAILMDLQMPIMNGYETTETIRKMNMTKAKDIPIIAMTADAFDDAMRKGFDSGMDEFLTKPLDKKLLTKVLMKYLK